MAAEFWAGLAGTIVLWGVSGSLAIALGFALAAGSLSANRLLRLTARCIINTTRGIPTSLLVITAAMAMIRLAQAPELPIIYPGTPASFQHVAWAIVFALAFGSAGHLAEIFCAARGTLGQYKLDQITVLGLSPLSRGLLITREVAATALPPTGTRLVHHLHNTAFAALFPVVDLFGFVHSQASATFRVFEFIMLGCAAYVILSAFLWIIFRFLEDVLAVPTANPRKRRLLIWA